MELYGLIHIYVHNLIVVLHIIQALNLVMHKWLAGLYSTSNKPTGVTYP